MENTTEVKKEKETIKYMENVLIVEKMETKEELLEAIDDISHMLIAATNEIHEKIDKDDLSIIIKCNDIIRTTVKRLSKK